MSTTKCSLFIAVVASMATIQQSAQAGVVWSENFETATVGNNLTTLGAPWGGAGVSSYTVRDFGTPFGSPNKWLQLQAFGNPWTFVNNVQTGVTLSTVSFDFYADATARKDGYLRVALSANTQTFGLVDINLDSALTIGEEVPENTALHFDIVSNITGGTVNYNGTDIGTDEIDVWVNGVRLIDSKAGTAGKTSLVGFGIWINNGTTVSAPVDSFYMDNFAWSDMATVVPEPSTFALAGIGLAGLLIFRRRK